MACGNVIDDGVNGYLCMLNYPSDLADKMEQIISMTPTEREVKGLGSRAKVERQFDEEIVIRKYLEAIEIAISRKQS